MEKSFATRCDAVEMTRACGPFPAGTDPRDRHDGGHRSGPGGVHLADCRHKDDVDTRGGAHGQIGLDRAWILGQVLRIPELERVHEDAHCHDVAFGAGPLHERGVTRVQRPHRRHQAHGATGGPGPVEELAAAGGGLDDLHR